MYRRDTDIQSQSLLKRIECTIMEVNVLPDNIGETVILGLERDSFVLEGYSISSGRDGLDCWLNRQFQ